MLDCIKDIFENRPDAFVKAIAASDQQIAKSGGDWYGTGLKGCILLMQSGTFETYSNGLHYIKAGLALLEPALAQSKNNESPEAAVLHYASGCGFAASARHADHFSKSKDQFERVEGALDQFAPWCADWQHILLSAAASETGNPNEAKEWYQRLSFRDADLASRYFDIWQSRRGTK